MTSTKTLLIHNKNTLEKMQISKREFSLHELPERPGKDTCLTPRSREACSSEGIDAIDLIYRPIEEFADRQLSPRIIKLRYDYFEAKRKDLLGLALAARDKLIESSRSIALARSLSATDSTVSSSSLHKSEWGVLAMEKMKLNKFQEGEKKWLESCLKHELALLRRLEAEDMRLNEEGEDKNKKMIEESKRLKDLNDRRREIEEQKQRVSEAQQELEKEKAKQAFEKRQEELRAAQESDERKKREAHERSLREAEQRALRETEIKQQQDKLWQDKQRALQEIQQQDRERLDIIERCKGTVMEKLQARRIAKEERVLKSIQKNRDLERLRKNDLVKKLVADQTRDERLAIVKQEHIEQAAKKSLQLMLRRKIIQDESQKRSEERRGEIIAQQADLDQRLREHELKKRRHTEFKQELEMLREKNKLLNVDRQRKKEVYLRELYAKRVVEKDSKVEKIFTERQQLWELRRKTALESQKSRDFVKKSIMDMRIKSKIDSKQLESYVAQTLNKLDPSRSRKARDHVETLFEAECHSEATDDIQLDICETHPETLGPIPLFDDPFPVDDTFLDNVFSRHEIDIVPPVVDLTRDQNLPSFAIVDTSQTNDSEQSTDRMPDRTSERAEYPNQIDLSRTNELAQFIRSTGKDVPTTIGQQFTRSTGDLHLLA